MSDVDLLEIVAKIVSFEKEQAVPIASHRRVTVQPHALVLCTLAMAGEDTTVHIVACGRVGQRPDLRSVPDPRFRNDQYELFEWLGERVERYYDECRRVGTHPQIWVSSEGAIKHLDILADRLRYNQQNLRVKRLGELLTYATERYPIHGQQALHCATRALRFHYATGQQIAEDEHLGTLLTWIDPPSGSSVFAAVALAEQKPMGVKTDPEFDRLVLEGLVTAYNRAKRDGAPPGALRRRAVAVHESLVPVVTSIYEATQVAISILRTRWRRPLAGLNELQRRETEEFESFMRSRDAGYFLPLRDKPKPAAFKLTERENARETAEAALYAGDRVALARGQLAGRVLAGTVQNPRRVRTRPRIFESTFDILSNQRVLRVRPRDELHLLNDPRHKVLVRTVERTGRVTRVGVEITKGSRAVGLPPAGTLVEFTPAVPHWDALIRIRMQLSERLAVQPWTHTAGSIPARTPSSAKRPADLLAAVENLR
jgi:hypothetical protein